MTAMEFVEKRGFQRMEVECMVEYKEFSGAVSGVGTVENVSANGILFVCERAIKRKSNLLITMIGGRNDKPMHGDAIVLRCEQGDQGYRVACWVNALE